MPDDPDAVICCTMLHKTEISIVASTFFRFLGGRMWTNVKQVLSCNLLQTSAKILAPDLVAPMSLCRIQGFRTVWTLDDIWKVLANSAISKKAVCRWAFVSPKQQNSILRSLFERFWEDLSNEVTLARVEVSRVLIRPACPPTIRSEVTIVFPFPNGHIEQLRESKIPRNHHTKRIQKMHRKASLKFIANSCKFSF